MKIYGIKQSFTAGMSETPNRSNASFSVTEKLY